MQQFFSGTPYKKLSRIRATLMLLSEHLISHYIAAGNEDMVEKVVCTLSLNLKGPRYPLKLLFFTILSL